MTPLPAYGLSILAMIGACAVEAVHRLCVVGELAGFLPRVGREQDRLISAYVISIRHDIVAHRLQLRTNQVIELRF